MSDIYIYIYICVCIYIYTYVYTDTCVFTKLFAIVFVARANEFKSFVFVLNLRWKPVLRTP